MSESQYFMIPGPTQVPPSILRAGSAPMVNHRGPEYQEMFKELTTNMQAIYKTKNDLLTLTSSGTGGLEASVSNFLNVGDKVIVASIGNFGDRYYDVCKKFGIDAELMSFAWGTPIDSERIAQRLKEDVNHEIKAVLCQHNETSTGVYNDLAAVSKARGDHPALLFVDSISGLGAVPLETDAWKLDVVVAASQKALMSPPGLAFVSVSERAWQAYDNCSNSRFYFDLKSAKEFLQKWQNPFTPAVATVYSALAATRKIMEQGIDEYVAEHFLRRDIVRAGVEGMGLKCLSERHCASPVVTTILMPEGGISPSQIIKPLCEKFNIVLAGGQGKLKDTIFRIGHVGYMNTMDILVAMSGIEMAFNKAGYPVVLGSGVGVAQKYMLDNLW